MTTTTSLPDKRSLSNAAAGAPGAPNAPRRSLKHPLWLGSVALIVCVVAAFWRLKYAAFCTYDDPLYITSNQDLKLGLSGAGLKWAFFGVNTCNWHPLTTLSNLAEYQFFQYNAAVYHIDNVIFHVLATVLLFQVLSRMTGMIGRSFVVAALFGLHPIHVQSVAWVSERKDVLSAVFCMLTLWAYLAYTRKPGWGRYALVLVMFACGVMSKPMLVTLPPALLLLDFWPLGRMRVGRWIMLGGKAVPLRRLILEKLPLLAIAAFSAIVTFQIQRNYGATATIVRVPIDFRIANAASSYLLYLWKTLWPHALAVFYPLSGDMPYWKLYVVILLLTSLLIAWTGRRWPWVMVGWFWYVGMLVPVIGLVQVGDQALADRYTYLPLIGPFIAVVWCVAELFKRYRLPPRVRVGATAILLIALGVRTWIECGYWKGTQELFTRATIVVPRNARAHLALGSWALKAGDLDTALTNLRLAVQYDPGFPEAQNRYGVALVASKQHDEAGVAFAKAVTFLESESSEAELRRDKVYHEAQYNLGLIRLQQGNFDDAIYHFNQRLRVTPDEKKCYAGLAEAYVKQGKLTEAVDAAKKAIAIDPDYPPAHYNLGLTRIRQGDLKAAVGEFVEVIRVAPEDPDSRYQMSEALARLGHVDDAIAQLRALLKYNPQEARANLKLGALLQASGHLEEAIAHYHRALEIDPNSAAANNLAWVLATCAQDKYRDGKQAIALAQRLSQQPGDDRPEVLDTLAAAYAEAGDFNKAIAAAQAAIEAAKGNAKLTSELTARLDLYRAGRPYRDSPR